MKKLILLAILFSGCDKPEKETFVPPKKDIKVVEYVTNLPVAGANLDLYEYTLFNYNYLYRGLTDNNGICKVPIDKLTDPMISIAVTKVKYWRFDHDFIEYLVYLQPEGWVQLRIRKANFYPSDSKLFITIKSTTENKVDFSEFNTGSDSLIMVRGFGNMVNNIEWKVSSEYLGLMKSGAINGLEIPKFDTLTGITLNY